MLLIIGLLGVVGLLGTGYWITKNPEKANVIYLISQRIYSTGLTPFLTTIKQYFAHKTSKHLVEIHPKKYIINYPYGVHWYQVVVPRNRGPCKINQIIGYRLSTPFEPEDVTDYVKTMMGPCYNFHGIPTTSKMIGFSRLVFFYTFEGQKEFYDDKIIIVE